MKEYNLKLTKDEFNNIKYALSIAEMQLKYKTVMISDKKILEAYREQERKMEKLLEELTNMEDIEEDDEED